MSPTHPSGSRRVAADIYQLPSGRYRVRFRWPNGGYSWRTVDAANDRAAMVEQARVQEQADAGTLPMRGGATREKGVTLGEYVETWIQWGVSLKSWRPQTAKNKRALVRDLFALVKPSRKMAALGRAEWDLIHAAWLEQVTSGAIAQGTYRNRVTLVRQITKQAATEKVIPHNWPAAWVLYRPAEVKRVQRPTLTAQMLGDIRRAAASRSAHERVMADLLCIMGARRGAIAQARVEDFDLELGVWLLRAVAGNKTMQVRDLALPPNVVESVQEYVETEQPGEWMFPSPRRPGKPVDGQYVAKRLKLFTRDAGIVANVNPHDVRAALSTLYRQVAGRDVSADQLAHSRAVSEQIYDQGTHAERRDAAEQIAAMQEVLQ